MDYTPFLITFKLAVFTTVLLLIIAIPVAYVLAFKKFRGKIIIESIIMMPIILPPTVLGFYYLNYLGPKSAIGDFFARYFDFSFAFSFSGILIGSIIYCMPFMITPIISGLRNIPRNTIESTYLLKKTRFNALFFVFIPIIKRSFWNAIILTFAHTIGEFGLILMIGGKMESTNVASVAIYDEMNAMNYEGAHMYSIILLLLSFVLIFCLNYLTRKKGADFA